MIYIYIYIRVSLHFSTRHEPSSHTGRMFSVRPGEGDSEVLERWYDSLSDEDEDGPGVEHACEDNLFNIVVFPSEEFTGPNEFC